MGETGGKLGISEVRREVVVTISNEGIKGAEAGSCDRSPEGITGQEFVAFPSSEHLFREVNPLFVISISFAIGHGRLEDDTSNQRGVGGALEVVDTLLASGRVPDEDELGRSGRIEGPEVGEEIFEIRDIIV